MKKLISLISILCLVAVLFCSCGKKTDNDDATSANSEPSTSQTTVIEALESAEQGVDEVVMNEIDENEEPIDGDAEIATSSSSNSSSKNNNSSSKNSGTSSSSSSSNTSSTATSSSASSSSTPSSSSSSSSGSSSSSSGASSEDTASREIMQGTPWE